MKLPLLPKNHTENFNIGFSIHDLQSHVQDISFCLAESTLQFLLSLNGLNQVHIKYIFSDFMERLSIYISEKTSNIGSYDDEEMINNEILRLTAFLEHIHELLETLFEQLKNIMQFFIDLGNSEVINTIQKAEINLIKLKNRINQLYNSDDIDEISYIAIDIFDSITTIIHHFHELKKLKRYDGPNSLS